MTRSSYGCGRRVLRRPGVACFNLFGSHFDPSFRAISEAFDDRGCWCCRASMKATASFLVSPDRASTSPCQRCSGGRAPWKRVAAAFASWLRDMAEVNGLGDRLKYDASPIIDRFSRPYVT